jgi:hypothetical protein
LADRQRDRVCDQERAALARRAARVWPAQDNLQSVRSLEPPRRVQQDFAELARKGGKPERIMIDATHRAAAHRSARWRINEWLGLNAHVGHACRAIEHPGRNLERPRYIRAVQRATEDAIAPSAAP